MGYDLAVRLPGGEIISTYNQYRIRRIRRQNPKCEIGLLVRNSFVSIEAIIKAKGNIKRAYRQTIR